MEAELAGLLARHEITAVVLRYARAIDRMDAELLRSCYWPDAIEDHGGAFLGTRDEFVAHTMRRLAPMTATTHHVSNVQIEIEGDTAYVESYVLAVHDLTPDDGVRRIKWLGGRYADRFARRDGEWRIVKRLLLIDWTHGGPLEPAFGSAARDSLAGTMALRPVLRSREDPAYVDAARRLLA